MYASGEPVYISDIMQAVIVIVDEKGTVAAAATAAVSSLWGAPPVRRPIDFIADRPFIFTITAPCGAPLFAGVYREP